MEVTRTNFQKVLEELDSVLQNASFLGIDGEFTGLNSGPDASAFDTPAQYYAKLRSGSMDFLLVQFGLSVFTYNTEKNKYHQQSYNFYVFPRPLNRAAPDCRFMCQASSMSFLADHGFDFNKLFAEGIPYLTNAEEGKLNKKIEDRQKIREDNLELIPVSDDDRPQIEEICSKIDEFLNSEAEELIVDRCNAFIRRIIHQEARMRWPNKLRLEGKTDSSGQCLIVQRTGTQEEEEKKEAERREKEQNEIKQAVGLSALLRKISDSGKLIIGHNMLLDLCHIVHQFFAPLPESYHEFKALIHCLFPRLLDTKIMCQSPQFRESIPCSILKALHETVGKPPYSIPEMDVHPDRSYTSCVDKSHEAGYDAYITGLCFISLSNHLGSLQKPEVSVVLPNSPLLNPFMNRLLITRLKDFPYIDLTGKDPNPSREHVFHITFPKEWKLSDISHLFSSFGGVYVSWLTDTTAYVGLNRRDQVAAVNKHNFGKKNFQIQKYAEYQASIESKTSGVTAQGDRKRKLSSSSNTSPMKEQVQKMEINGAAEEESVDEGWELASGNNSINFVNASSMNFNNNNNNNSNNNDNNYHNNSKNDYKSEKQRCSKNLHNYAAAVAVLTNSNRCSAVDLEKNHIVIDKDDNLSIKSDKMKCDVIKSVQKVRLKNTMSLPSDFRNHGGVLNKNSKKEIVPKYTILKRNPDQIDIKNIIENSETLRSLAMNKLNEDIKKSTNDDLIEEKIGDAENGGSLNSLKSILEPENVVKNGKLYEVKKQSLTRAKSNPISSDRLKTVHEKFDNIAINNSFTSQKKLNKTPGSTPSASPKAKRSPNKKHAKQKSSDFSSFSNLLNVTETVLNGDKVLANSAISDSRQLNIEKLKNFDKSDERLTLIGFNVDSKIKEENSLIKLKNRASSTEEKVELKKPSMKLLRSARKRSENVILTGSLFFRVAQIVGVLLLLYVIIVF